MYAHSSIVGETAICVCTLPFFIDGYITVCYNLGELGTRMFLQEEKNHDNQNRQVSVGCARGTRVARGV